MTSQRTEHPSPREQLLISDPARPKAKDRDTVSRAFYSYSNQFEQTWKGDMDRLLADVITAVESTRDPWGLSKWLEGLGWAMCHDTYLLMVSFWRSLETHRIEREIEWVVRCGSRFPAKAGQAIVFSQRGNRYSGEVSTVDRARARAIVSVKDKSGQSNFSVESEQVLMVQDAR